MDAFFECCFKFQVIEPFDNLWTWNEDSDQDDDKSGDHCEEILDEREPERIL